MKEKNFGQSSGSEEFPVEETKEELKARLERETGEKIATVIDDDERRRRKAEAERAIEDFKAGQKRIPFKR